MYIDTGQFKKLDTQFEKLWAEIRRKIYNEFDLPGSTPVKWRSYYAASLQEDAGNELNSKFTAVDQIFTSELKTAYSDSYNRTNSIITTSKTQPKAKNLTENDVNDAISTTRKGEDSFTAAIKRQKEFLTKQISDLIGDTYKNRYNVHGNNKKIQDMLTKSKNDLKKLMDTELEYYTALGVIDCCEQRGLKEYVFVAVIDKRTSNICKRMHLHKYPIKKAEAYKNMPPMHQNCRSSVIPFDEIDYERMKAGKKLTNAGNGDILESTYYTQWVYGYLSKNYPLYLSGGNSESAAYYSELALDIHDILDAAGLVPGFGEAADFANLVIYLIEGNVLGAVISAISILPGGDSAKLLRKIENIADAIGTNGKKVIKDALDRAIKAISNNSGSVRIGKDALEETSEKLGKEIAEETGEKVVKEVVEGAGSAKGLIGKDFEEFLTKKIGGNGSFSKGGRDFDGGIGNRWWEAKSGDYWINRANDPKAIEKFKSDMGHRLKIANDNDATYELFSNTPIPQVFKDYLTKKGIPFTEMLD